MPAETPAWCMGLISQPLRFTHTRTQAHMAQTYVHVTRNPNIMVLKGIVLLVQLTVSSALSFNCLHILINTTCQSSLKTYWLALTSPECTGLHSRLALKVESGGSCDKHQGGNWKVCWGLDHLHPRGQSGICSQPIIIRVSFLCPVYLLIFRIRYACRTGWGGRGKSQGIATLKAHFTHIHRSVGCQLNEWLINSGAVCWYLWMVRTSHHGRLWEGWCKFPLFHPPCNCWED
jgi:hypothetical protein